MSLTGTNSEFVNPQDDNDDDNSDQGKKTGKNEKFELSKEIISSLGSGKLRNPKLQYKKSSNSNPS